MGHEVALEARTDERLAVLHPDLATPERLRAAPHAHVAWLVTR